MVGMDELEEGDPGALGMPAKKKSIPAALAPTSFVRVLNAIVHVGCRGCGKKSS
jgi:hypothetical protein